MDNPFFHRGAIRRAEEFHDRRSELGQILGLLRNGQSVSLIGPRRIGKSSLLLHLCRLTVREEFGLSASSSLFALIDCQELAGSPPEEVYEALITSIIDASKRYGIEFDMVDRPGSYRSLDQLLNSFQKSGVSVVILLDEFELLAANEQLTPYFFARLRGLTSKHGLAFLTSSQRPLFAITADVRILSSPFFNIFVTLPLGMFSYEEAWSLIDQRLEGTGVYFPNELREHLLSLVGPHPFFLHVAGDHAFRMLVNNKNVADLKSYEQIDSAIEIELESHLSYLWQHLAQDERYSLATTEGPIEVLRQLEQQCLLTMADDQVDHSSGIIKRFTRRQLVEGLIQTGPFSVDPQRHRVFVDGQVMELTTSQFDLLVRLARQSGHVVPGEELEAAVWGDAPLDDPDRLKTLIKRLRRAISPYSSWIVSERGIGYALREP
jgi:hypothetical protein